ncbi:EAL domain-containing protein [Pseudohongiella sp.]|uniref:Diguanylate cyclase/phosphodiesterase with PAS/PAC sensor(S) n=1 Tax=marine sediment metagenome TaxID=412755 RepID=A0A0F9VS77_9ZZZZ|nr:EAL domain-containing protein [Pseudohongiella sp.]HDZ10133.1 EAL domain-containing protein [Pseudohongiella sp.]HEA64336.1 EAL domain-containing protein [Pseudohongiella sp.]
MDVAVTLCKLLNRHAVVPVLLLLCATVACPVTAQTTLRVGVYENTPKIFLDGDGRIGGMFGELLTEIAQREAWQIEPVPCQWNECLQMLESGTLDIMPDVAYIPERAQRFDFHRNEALLSWSQLYERDGLGLFSLLDLDGLRLAVLRGSIQQRYLMELAENFDLAVEWVWVDSLAAAFQAVASGLSDAAVANHFYGDMMAFEHGLQRTPIMFQPSRLYFAVPAGRHADLLAVIDTYLDQWKTDESSPYYDLLRRWSIEPDAALPVVVWWLIGILALALLGATLFAILLRFKVAEKTQSLTASETRLNTILNSVDAHIYIKDYKLRYQYANRKVCDFFGMSLDDIVGKKDSDFFDEKTCALLEQNDLQVIRHGERVADEEASILVRNQQQHDFLSIKIPLRNPDNSIYALCGISTDISELKQIRDQLHQLAFFDSLTGLPNRRLVLDRLDHAMAGRNKTGYEGALLFLDLDDFKVINDTLGHDAGDQLLQMFARRLERGLLSTDTVGRLGADEFVLIVEDIAVNAEDSLVRVRDMADILRRQLNQPFDLAGVDYVCAVSIGIAMFSDAKDGDVEALLKAADLALNAAKTEGNSVCFFNPEMQIEVTRRTRIETALRKALAGDNLDLHLQPQVDAEGRVFSMEALLRWHDPQMGQVAPSDFIPVAETCGLIVPLGEWVLATACEMLADWKKDPVLSTLTLAVNISPRQFHHADFVDHILKCLERNQVDGARLELEVTEGLLIENVDVTVEKMDRLRERGIRFSLDDFGTGYASLGYLKRLPLSQLKIDQSFVRDLLLDPNDEAIVRTILALGSSLDLRVLAEGVETLALAERLREMGCQYFQGYYFSRPQPESYWRGQWPSPLAGSTAELHSQR